MLFAGFGMMMTMASSNTLLQTVVDDDKRGRIMSLYVMSFMGTAPVGSILSGSIASKIGTPYTVFFSGLVVFIFAIIFAKNLPSLKKHIRPIYVKMGIIPEVSKGLQSATHLNMPPND